MDNFAKGIIIGLVTLAVVIIGWIFLNKQRSKSTAGVNVETVEREDVKVASARPEVLTWDGRVHLYNVDDKTAALIMAIVSDTTGIDLDHLMFKSIKALV